MIVDHEISPSQTRNLERATGAQVLDRTGVIMEIFHRHAHSREAKLQVAEHSSSPSVEVARTANIGMIEQRRLVAALAGGDPIQIVGEDARASKRF